MKIRNLVGPGMAIVLVSGCAIGPQEVNAPTGAAQPTPLIPQAYAVPQAAAAPTSPPPTVPQFSSMPMPPARQAPQSWTGQFPAMISNPYHPYWIVDIH
jgi:hypothetical protein